MGRLLPALRAFNPELVLLSSGFDAAQLDVGNSGVGETAGLDLTSEDFFWVTKEIQMVRSKKAVFSSVQNVATLLKYSLMQYFVSFINSHT
jgi:acetoin utilization deacetylase AcuC-like enzyme